MKKLALSSLLVTLLAASSPSYAGGWRLLPVLDNDLKFEPTLAFTINSVDPDGWKNATAYGLDFNFNCGLLQDPDNRMRTHLNISRADDDGLKLMAYELSPRYTLPLSNNFSFGVGPSLALFSVEQGNYDEMLFGVGLAAGVNYRSGKFYAGADLRIHKTDSEGNNGSGNSDFDNIALGAKVGINF